MLIAVAVYFSINNNKNEENSYQANRTSSADTQNDNNKTNDEQNNEKEEENNKNETNKSEEKTEQNNTKNEEERKQEYKEEQLSTFTTKIYSKDSERQNNIKITCNTLNGTTVKTGETFSFCSTVGKATSDKGYQEADVFDHNGNKTKGLRWWKLPSK